MSGLTLDPGQVLGSGPNAYLIGRELGRGASGVVYLARPIDRPEERVALKLVDGIGSLDAQLIEPEILSRINNENTIRLLDYCFISGKLALVMEYIDGPDLTAWVGARGRLSPGDVRIFLTQMARALAHAHAEGVVHRDLKPSNILVARDGATLRYVLADFGISRRIEGIQASKQLAGSYRFMAPEQLRGRASTQSDLWSLGVIAYWLLTGTLPFDGKTLVELSKQIIYGSPIAPSAIVGDLDGELENLILKLLAKDPIERIDSAETLLKELGDESPVATGAAPRARTRKLPSWEFEIDASIRLLKRRFFVFLFLWASPELIVGWLLLLLGAYNIYLQQARIRGVGRLLAGLCLIVLGLPCMVLTEVLKRSLAANSYDPVNFVIGLLDVLNIPYVSQLLAAVAVYNFVRWKKLERERFLLRTLRTRGPNDLDALKLLRNYLERNPEELLVRQRLAEMYFLRDQFTAAIIEAKLILSIDAYNFATSLLLAQSYARIGLLDEAEAVCEGYLTVSPQSFEFIELREYCLTARNSSSSNGGTPPYGREGRTA
jgi:serine/threonine-protein kinase